MSIFDGLDEIFTATFGEPVIYTPKATGVPLGANGTISAVWIEEPIAAPFGETPTDDIRLELHLQASVVLTPREGDSAVRVKTGKSCKIVPPLRPDGRGMIACAMEAL